MQKRGKQPKKIPYRNWLILPFRGIFQFKKVKTSGCSSLKKCSAFVLHAIDNMLSDLLK